MPVPSWPSDLPQRAEQQGYGRVFADGRLRQPMGQGPSKVRRRFSAAFRPVSLVYRMSPAQLARLERFWSDDTSGGVLPFVMPDAVFDGSSLLSAAAVPVLFGDAPILAAASWLVQFGEGAPQASAVSFDIYDVSFSVEVLP